MTQAPMPPTETAYAFAPPMVTQFSVFLANRVGKLLDLVQAFDESECRICALSVNEATDSAIIRLVTNNSKMAKHLLLKQGLAFSESDLLVVELSSGHTLSSLCLSLLGAELNIHFAYPLMLRPNGTPTIALSVDDLTLAGQILRRKHFRLFGEADLSKGTDHHDH
jgi:hypothetical protein